VAIVGSSCWYASISAENETYTYTQDVEMGPSSVWCTAALSSFGTTGAVISAGFSQYRTRNPTTGVDRVVSLSSLGVPSFYATNCDSVTLMAWVNDFNGGSSAQPLFNIYYLG
jgi:hypothetical protein